MPLSKLNKEQLEAATAPFGNNLIIASAGTGKTSTIVARIAHLLQNGVEPSELMLLTFTNKAALEMVERVGRFFPKEVVNEIEAGTFHAIAYRLLKKSGRELVLKEPKELKILLRSLHEKRRFSHIEASTAPYSASYLYDIYSLYQNVAFDGSFGAFIEERYPDHSPYSDIYQDLIEEFEVLKGKFNYIDFNGLLLEFIDYLKDGEIAFKEILVDEYQDTNRLQNSLIEHIKKESLFCVGDYDQSIYAFNGADIGIIGSFKDNYPNAKVFTLTKNYRSSKAILSLANRVISKNPRLYPKELEVTKTGNFPPPKLLVFHELFEQYEAIAKMISESKTKHSEIAVIFRNNASADGLEANLRELGIASKRKGGVSFFDSKEIKAIIDIYSIILNPNDMMSFIHLFEYAKGVGGVFAKDIFDALYKVGEGDIYRGLFDPKDKKNPYKKGVVNHQLGLFDDVVEEINRVKIDKGNYPANFIKNPILKHPRMNRDLIDFIYRFYQIVKKGRSTLNPAKLVREIYKSELFHYISNTLATKRATNRDGSIDETKREDALLRIEQKARLLEELSKNYEDRYRFINSITLGGGEMSQGEGVNLLSIHASKGLEFDEVFVIDLMDGRFPNYKLLNKNGNSENIEEERRLFYVAVTRAREILYLSYAKYDKIKDIEYLHSPFLEEAGLVKPTP